MVDLFTAAANVMRHLESKREAAERRRVALMSKGIASFLERISRVTEADLDKPGFSSPSFHGPDHGLSSPAEDLTDTQEQADTANIEPKEDGTTSPAETLDKIKLTLDHAANILRESLELTTGGVVFLDTALGYNQNTRAEDAYFDIETDLGAMVDETLNLDNDGEFDSCGHSLDPNWKESVPKSAISPGQARVFKSPYKPAKVLSISTAKVAEMHQSRAGLDWKTLQTFINTYPNGNVWYIDQEGYFSSLEQVSDLYESEGISPSGRRISIGSLDVTRQRAEALLLSKIFRGAKQIIFLPLWDAGAGKNPSKALVILAN
jgi:hypothetical protein